MQLPTKITPDRIKDALIQVYFEANIPFDAVVGYIYSALSNSFEYPNYSRLIPQNEPLINIFTSFLFVNDKIKIEIRPDSSLVFNCNDDYIGWSAYSNEIKIALEKIASLEIIEQYTRIGVRYISEFEDTNILENIEFSYRLPTLEDMIQHGNFQLQLIQHPYRIILNLKTGVPYQEQNEVNIRYKSVIDIDVIQDSLNITNLEDFLASLHQTHHKEKEVFFKLLKPGFLARLHPEY
jgi:uncharacterized protein (TIGR04255 family)